MELPAVSDLTSSGPAQRHAVGQLYRTYAGRLRSYFRGRGSNAAEAEDLTQETFVRVLRSVKEFRGDATQFPVWFWTIARRLLLDTRRASHARPLVDIDDDAVAATLAADPAGTDPAEQVATASLADCVKRSFAQFSHDFPERAQCLSWLVTDRLDISGVATILGRTVAATREYLSQCRKKLKPYLAPCLSIEDEL